MKTNTKAAPAKKATIKKTNKNKTDVTKVKPVVVKPSISEAEMAKVAAAAAKSEPPKTTSQYLVDIVRGVRFGWDEEHNQAVRKVEEVKVYSDHDLANEPAERDRLIEEAEDKLRSQGWFLCDSCCIRETRRQLEAEMDELRSAIEYDKICQCKAARQLEKLVAITRAVRVFEDSMLDVYSKFDGEFPRVLGRRFSDDFVQDKETGKISRKPLPKVQVHHIQGADLKDLSKALEQFLPKEVLAKIYNVAGQEISKLIATKVAPQIKQIEKK